MNSTLDMVDFSDTNFGISEPLRGLLPNMETEHEEAFESLEDAACRLLAELDKRTRPAAERAAEIQCGRGSVPAALDNCKGCKDCYEAPMHPSATTADLYRDVFTVRGDIGGPIPATRCGYGKTEGVSRLNSAANDDEGFW